MNALIIIANGHEIFITSAMIAVGLVIDIIVLSVIAILWRRHKNKRSCD
jgi:hypothetical protein